MSNFFVWGDSRNASKERGKEATGCVKKPPPPERQEEQAEAWCRYCLGEIYHGEAYYRIDGQAVCTDCLAHLAEDYFSLYKIEEEF